MKKLLCMNVLSITLLVSLIPQGYAKTIEFERDPQVVAKTLSHTHIKFRVKYIRKDVTNVQPHLREKLKIIHYTVSYDFGEFDQGFTEIFNLEANMDPNSPLFMNPDGSQTGHRHYDTRLVSLSYDGALRFPAWDTISVGEDFCRLAKNTKTLYCNGVFKFTIATHDYEAVYSGIGKVIDTKKAKLS